MSSNNASDVVIYLRLLKYIIPSWPWFLVAICGYLAYSAAQVLSADLLQFVVDAVGQEVPDSAGIVSSTVLSLLDTDAVSRTTVFLSISISFVVIAVIRGVGFFFGNYFLSKVSLKLVHELRCEVFGHMLKMPAQKFDQTATGELLAKVTYHVTQVADAATNAIRILLQEGLVVIGILAYMLSLNWKLTLLFLCILPVVGLIAAWIGKQFRRISRKIQQSVGDFTQVANEAISGFREVRLFGGESYEQSRFYGRSNDNFIQTTKLQFYSALGSPVILFFVSIALAVLIFMALKVSEQGTPGQFAAFITAAAVITRPVRQLMQVLAVIQKGLAACEDLFEFLDSRKEVDNGDYSTNSITGDVCFKDVSFCYNNDAGDVLKNVSFSILPGQSLALVGFSGSGKSTIVNLLSRFYEHDRGQITLDGKPIEDYVLSNLREHISIVTQNVTLFNDTIYNNVAYGCLHTKTQQEVLAAIEAANAKEFIDELPQGLNTIIGEDGLMLSGGQRQRIAIARAILKDAPILVMDEATSALDNRSEALIQKALEGVMKDRTSIVIAHRLSTIEMADQILVMDNGEIIESGNHQSLMQAGCLYKQLYEKNFES